MADAVIMVPGVMYGDLMAGALALTGKGGTCVVTGVAPQTQMEASVNLFDLAMMQKEIKGVIFGAANPRFDIPNLLALYGRASSSWTSWSPGRTGSTRSTRATGTCSTA